MSHSLISRNDDLRRLRDEGYEVSVVSAHLLVGHIPYVNSEGQVRYGTLVSNLTLNGDRTLPPDPHVAHFIGETPCDSRGRPLMNLIIGTEPVDLANGLRVTTTFSSKPVPPAVYTDYHHKMTTYALALSSHAEQLNPDVTARTFAVVDSQEEDVFHYLDTASSRAGIANLTDKLRTGPVAIVGLGGTGSYILDLLAKTPVAEIHLFDQDQFLQHNAFRSPGAPSKEDLAAAPYKVDYLANIYSRMRRQVVAHPVAIDETTVDALNEMAFVFIAVDHGPTKGIIINRLESFGISFVDVGMGVNIVDGSLIGVLRTTVSTNEGTGRALARAVISVEEAPDGDYATNIQIAELNALNAALAVIRFKKLFGFYVDLGGEHNSAYTIDTNTLINDEDSA